MPKLLSKACLVQKHITKGVIGKKKNSLKADGTLVMVFFILSDIVYLSSNEVILLLPQGP
jgi:hypothetical protein